MTGVGIELSQPQAGQWTTKKNKHVLRLVWSAYVTSKAIKIALKVDFLCFLAVQPVAETALYLPLSLTD